LHFSRALIAFHSKQYDTAHDFLNSIHKPEDFLEYLKWRVLLIKIYYELKKTDLHTSEGFIIDYETEAIRKYVGSNRNKKMSESIRVAHNNFVKAFNNILVRKKRILEGHTVSRKNLETLQTKIAEMCPLIERTWLEEKLTELIEQH